jgi:ribokinase
MKLLNFGSLNYDYVYGVDHIVQPGETLCSYGMETFCGGKGLNQSIALSRAGAEVYHAGMVGFDGGELIKMCADNGIDHSLILIDKTEKTGHTIIQVNSDGQNCILLYGGCNRRNTKENVDHVLTGFSKDDVLVLQNEINLIDYIIERAYEKGMSIVLNPSPYDEQMGKCNLNKVSVFLMNEIEGAQITGEKEPQAVLEAMHQKYPDAKVVLTLGKLGVMYCDREQTCSHGIYKVPVVDTTAAGDTFTGYFIASILREKSVAEALRLASVASSISVTRKGATSSIPMLEEVEQANIPPLQ